MKNLIGVMFSIIGVFLVGVGSYVYFENYGYYLESSLKNNLYEGVYKNDDNNIVIKDKDDSLIVTINNEQYEFIKDNNIYINEESGLEITINGNELKLSKNGEIVMICYK
jgi:uncharacterized protein YneR